MGLLQAIDWVAVDKFFQLRPLEPIDSRIVIVTIDDRDISNIGEWPISDHTLSKLLRQIHAQQPRVIGVDLYRDLPVEPGSQELIDTFALPTVIGIGKFFGTRRIPPPPVLAELDRVTMSDLIIDADGKVRRGLISARDEQGQVLLGLGTAAALRYLQAQGITPVVMDPDTQAVKLGQASILPFAGNDGGYHQADDDGYQIFLNYRGMSDRFQVLSLTDALAGRIPEGLLRDRLVLIGSIAESTNDFFPVPYSSSQASQYVDMPGVLIHANLASQIISAALDARPLIQVLPEPLEWVWVLMWSAISTFTSWHILQIRWFSHHNSYSMAVLFIGLQGGLILVISYGLFLGSWWVPVAPPLLGLITASSLAIGLHHQKLKHIAYIDRLTQVANRHSFDQRLAQLAHTKTHLSLILCDVDYFKLYNDTYGHQAGDVCLQQVASAIQSVLRRNDLLARYGGEEFVVLLPDADKQQAIQIAERIVAKISSLKIEHLNSRISHYVTLSCGVASKQSRSSHDSIQWSSMDLIVQADKALYVAKQSGRNCYALG